MPINKQSFSDDFSSTGAPMSGMNHLIDDTMISIKRGMQPTTGGSPSITDLGAKIFQGSRNN